MPLFIGDYLKDTGRLTTEQHGAYLLLIMDYWANGAPSDDDDELAAITRLEVRVWRRHRPKIERFFRIADGLWRHKRIDEELIGAQAKSDKAAEKAAAAANARWERERAKHEPEDALGIARSIAPGTPKSNAPDLLEECPSPSPSPPPNGGLKDADASFVAGQPDDGPKYPELFEAAWQAYRHVKGRSSKKLSFAAWKRLPATIRQALPAASARYGREGREPNEACGAQAMERWLRDEKFADWMAPTTASCALIGADWPESKWAAAIKIWRSDGSWDDRLGPEPSEPGCRAPSNLLIQPVNPRTAA